MKVSENEILFIYDSADIQQREGLAYAKSLRHYKIKELDIKKDKLTQLQLSNIARFLNVSPSEMLNPDSESNISDVMNLDNNDFLYYLVSNLTMLRMPIAVYSDHARFIGSQYELIKEDGVNSKSNVQSSRTIGQREAAD
jgi:arsenate reductase-like glutaredoxin family protein